MKKDWFESRVDDLSKLRGYVKPEKHEGVLKLDSNENFAIPKQFQSEIILGAKKNSDIREYPLGREEHLYKEIAKYLGVQADMVGIGNGSDQILDLILSNFAIGKKIITSDPTFGFFEERCKLYSISTIKIPFSKDMELDYDEFLAKSKSADIIYLDSPNNPTGFQFERKKIESIIKAFSGLVIVDEAYGEFSEYSLSKQVKKYPNLIVVRTLSKAFGMAGLRLGYFVANKKFTEVFRRVIQYPYPVNTMAIEGGILALQKAKMIGEVANNIKEERQKIIDNLKKYEAFDVFDSMANFVLFDAKGADKRVYNALVEQGISIRKLGKIGEHDGCLRVTVGTSEMNSKFLLAIRDLLR